jgi:hypothetical protein
VSLDQIDRNDPPSLGRGDVAENAASRIGVQFQRAIWRFPAGEIDRASVTRRPGRLAVDSRLDEFGPLAGS